MNTTFPHKTLAVLLLLLFHALPARAASPEDSAPNSAPAAHPGAAIYRSTCANCHGADGQGVLGGADAPDSAYDAPLAGDLSVADLAERIDQTMPLENPDLCVGDQARQVAAYIYQEFYSLEARFRKGLEPLPRVEVQRLTVPQFRNAVADVVRRFTPLPESSQGAGRAHQDGRRQERPDDRPPTAETQPAAPRGFAAKYYQSKGMSKTDKLCVERVDPQIDFDFGDSSPAEDISADQFAIIWQGSLQTHDTGYYQFRVTTPNGARLYLNNDPTPSRRKLRDDSSVAGQAALIDAWVSSGKLRKPTARVFLLGGRRYPIRLEFFKYKEDGASIRLEWKPPGGVWSVLNQHDVDADRTCRTFVVSTSFPADDRSTGYERGNSVSQQWYAAVMQAAVATAAEVVNRLHLLADVSKNDDPQERLEKLQPFALRFARAAFRRPLTDLETKRFGEAMFQDVDSPEAGMRRAVIAVLMSPNFLYPDLNPGSEPSPYDVASRLSFTLWDSIPDEALLEAAARNQLCSEAQIRAQAERMLSDPRAREKLRGFFHDWLELEERDLSKDSSLFPEFDAQVVADLRHSLEAFVERVMWSKASDYRQLLLADYLLLNDRLERVYAARDVHPDEKPGTANAASAIGPSDGPSDDRQKGESEPSESSVVADESAPRAASPEAGEAPERSEPANRGREAVREFEAHVVVPRRRAGVLTHPYLLSAFAYHNNTSPIHRGVFLTRNIMGRGLKPPPVAVAFKDDEFDPDLTMREKVTQLTRDKACMSCHSVINPLGFALENYDAVGRWRTMDRHQPVNTKSDYVTVEGKSLEIASARDIAEFAASSPSAHRAFVTQIFHHLVKATPIAFGVDTVAQLRNDFVKHDYNMKRLVVDIAVLAAKRDDSSTTDTSPQPSRTTARKLEAEPAQLSQNEDTNHE